MSMVNQNEPNNTWSESDVDRLLQSFYAAEMPDDLRTSAATTTTVAAQAKTRQSNMALWAGLVATAAALMVAVIVTRPGADDQGHNVANNIQQLLPTDLDTDVIERVETENGMLEMRTRFVESDSTQDDADMIDLRGLEFDYSFDGEAQPMDDDSSDETIDDSSDSEI